MHDHAKEEEWIPAVKVSILHMLTRNTDQYTIGVGKPVHAAHVKT